MFYSLGVVWPPVILVSVNFVIISSVTSLTFQCVDFLHLEYQKISQYFFNRLIIIICSLIFFSFLFLKCEYSIFRQKNESVWIDVQWYDISMNTQCAFLSSTFTSILWYARVKQSAWTCIRASAFSGFALNKPLHQNGSLNDFTFWRSYQDIDPLLFIRHCKSKKVVIKMMLFIFSLICTYVLVSTSVASHFFK